MSPGGPSRAGPLQAGPASAGASRGSRLRFLFREEAGTIDAATWRLHAAWLVALAAVLTMVWWALRPYAHHDLATQAFLAPMTIVAYAYLIVYAFALLLIAVCYVLLTMKRFRAVGAPAGLAGLVPLLALFAASAHFLRAQTPDAVALAYVVALDAALVAVALWTIAELGVRPLVFRAGPPTAAS